MKVIFQILITVLHHKILFKEFDFLVTNNQQNYL
jgi:hypothetical protein